MSRPRIILASTSRYRAAMLRRLTDDFGQIAPGVNETVRVDEAPGERAERLATLKAQDVATRTSDAIVIGSDQVAALERGILHKPGNMANAREQLRASSGNVVDFYTAVCVVDAANGQQGRALDHTRVVLRSLGGNDIERYLAREQPLDCAGSFKVEGAGIALCERIESDDPTALIGLPLIALARLLREAGVDLP